MRNAPPNKAITILFYLNMVAPIAETLVPLSLRVCFFPIPPATHEVRTNEQDSGRCAQLSQLNSLSMVSISSSSDPSYRIMAMGRGELWQPPNVLQRDEMHVNNITVGDIVWQHDFGVRSVKGQRLGRFQLVFQPEPSFFPVSPAR